MQALRATAEEGTLLHAARVEALIGSVVDAGPDGGPAGAANWVQVISAFDVPKILYDPIRKSFYRAPQPTSLLGTAEVGTISVPITRSGLHAGLQQDPVAAPLCAGPGMDTPIQHTSTQVCARVDRLQTFNIVPAHCHASEDSVQPCDASGLADGRTRWACTLTASTCCTSG